MHIPDGYLAPAVSLALAIPTVPVWGLATQRVKKVLNNRTVPLLAIFSALSFTIMMFNVPVPGGTTAHGVGGTLIAVVLGPWAAVIAVSTALILQALFFGDGGILAIFANCLNMGIILPFVGYGTYRLLAAGSPILSTRRAVAPASAPTSASPSLPLRWASNSASSPSSSPRTGTPCTALTAYPRQFRRWSPRTRLARPSWRH